MTISRICRTAPLKGRNIKVCMWCEVPDVITPVKFNINRFGGFWFWGSKNRGIPLTRRVALTTVLHYRADCDIKLWQHSEYYDKELNILLYWMLSYIIIHRSHTLLKMVRFFGPPCISVYILNIHIMYIHRVRKKGAIIFFAITLSNPYRSSNFFYHHTQQ